VRLEGRAGTGLDPNLAATFAYLGGVLTGILFLIVEKQDRYVRFHAMQSTITFLGVFVLHLMLMGTPLGWMLTGPLVVGTALLWAFLMWKAFKGERYKLPYVGEWAEQQVK
jgi:uncharacterized membrane protein